MPISASPSPSKSAVPQVPQQLPLLYVHGALIEQALINVLENAARFSPAHGRLDAQLDGLGQL